MTAMNTHALAAPQLLWFDLTHDQSAADCSAAFADSCRIILVRELNLSRLSARQRPDMICMHYDRPDTLSLNLMLEVKRAVPAITRSSHA